MSGAKKLVGDDAPDRVVAPHPVAHAEHDRPPGQLASFFFHCLASRT